MECLVNHQTERSAKRYLQRALTAENWKTPSEAFEVPVLTATNRKNTFFETAYGNDPLAYIDRRHPRWSWWEKIYALEDNVSKFKAEGHEFFVYADADDAILWQAPTVKLCKEAVGGGNMLFQLSNHGFPRPAIFKRRLILKDKGPCAGAFIARTSCINDYCRMIRDLAEHGCPWVTSKNNRGGCVGFDDQGAWFTMACLLPSEILVDTSTKYLTKLGEPNFDEVL